MRRARTILTVSALLIVTSCGRWSSVETIAVNDGSDAAPRTVLFHRLAQSNGLTGLIRGQLVEDQGCLRIQPPTGASFLVLWPPSYTWRVENGTVVVYHGDEAVARVGDTIQLGGGAFGETPEAQRDLRDPPAHCPAPYWQASTVVP